MTNEQAGILIKAIYNYHKGEELELDFGMKMAFAPFKNQFIRDDSKYSEFVDKQKLNGSKGGRPPKSVDNQDITINPTKPNETQETQAFFEKPKEPYNDSDSDSVNDNDSVNVNDIDDNTLINTVSTIIGTTPFNSDIKVIKGKILFQNGNLDDKINSIIGYYVDTFGKTTMSLQDIKNKLKQLQLN